MKPSNLARSIFTLIVVKLLLVKRNPSALRKVDAPVHLGGYSDGKHIEIVCDDSWVEPKWGKPEDSQTEDNEVHVADDDRLYTFVESKVTCKGCKQLRSL